MAIGEEPIHFNDIIVLYQLCQGSEEGEMFFPQHDAVHTGHIQFVQQPVYQHRQKVYDAIDQTHAEAAAHKESA